MKEVMLTKTTDKMQIAVYHINNDYKETYGNWNSVIDLIINLAQNSKNPKQYIKQDLKSDISSFKTQLYFYDGEIYPLKKISSFYSSIVKGNPPILSATKKDVSTLFFVYDEDELFVIPTGAGYFTIQDFIDYDFGLKIMSSIIDKNSNTIKNISYKSISGQVALNTRLFRNDYNLLNEDEFGKLFNEICAVIPQKKIIESLGLDNSSVNKDITCIGKSAFKLKKTINVLQVLNIIEKLELLLKTSEDIFNSVKYINNKGSDKEKIRILNKELLRKIYKSIKNGDSKLPFDISHREYMQYHTATYFQIYYDGQPVYDENLDTPPSDFQFLLDAAALDVLVLSSFEAFSKFIDKIEIYSYDDSGYRILTRGNLVKHISGEININEKTYFYIDGKWMQLKDKFIENLNRNCKEYLVNFFDNTILDTTWKNSENILDEDSYIDNVCTNNKNCIKIHPVKTSENLELCDIIKRTDSGDIQLIYIKDGFNHSIRDLTSQVEICQKRILEMQKSNNYDIISDYYDKICSSNNRSRLYNYSKKDFIDLFKKKDLTFVLAFHTNTHEGYTFMKDPEKFKSNIAKYSLIHTLKEISILDVSFNIKLCEIKNY